MRFFTRVAVSPLLSKSQSTPRIHSLDWSPRYDQMPEELALCSFCVTLYPAYVASLQWPLSTSKHIFHSRMSLVKEKAFWKRRDARISSWVGEGRGLGRCAESENERNVPTVVPTVYKLQEFIEVLENQWKFSAFQRHLLERTETSELFRLQFWPCYDSFDDLYSTLFFLRYCSFARGQG